MTLTGVRSPGPLFCRMSHTREVVFLLPHCEILVYNFGKRTIHKLSYPPALLQVQNCSALFSCLYVFVLCFLLMCGLAWGVKGEHLPGAS